MIAIKKECKLFFDIVKPKDMKIQKTK